jgi:DNA-binding transcriptional LysR family regulator
MSGRANRGERDLWLAIQMRHLAALAAVNQEASFHRAAGRLGYGQSAISRQIAYLERVTGHRLVERSARPVALTEAGAALMEGIEPILGELRRAKAEIDAIGANPVPDGIGVATIFGGWLPATLLPAILPAALEAAWDRLVLAPSARLLEAVAAGRLDAAFVEPPIPVGPFRVVELVHEPCVLVMPRPAATVAKALEQWPLVAIESCRATQSLLAGRCAGHVADSPGAALVLVRAGVAAAVMTSRDLSPSDAALHTLPAAGVPARELALAWHRDSDDCPAVAALRSAALRVFGS